MLCTRDAMCMRGTMWEPPQQGCMMHGRGRTGKPHGRITPDLAPARAPTEPACRVHTVAAGGPTPPTGSHSKASGPCPPTNIPAHLLSCAALRKTEQASGDGGETLRCRNGDPQETEWTEWTEWMGPPRD